jgi:hypothetical protein
VPRRSTWPTSVQRAGSGRPSGQLEQATTKLLDSLDAAAALHDDWLAARQQVLLAASAEMRRRTSPKLDVARITAPLPKDPTVASLLAVTRATIVARSADDEHIGAEAERAAVSRTPHRPDRVGVRSERAAHARGEIVPAEAEGNNPPQPTRSEDSTEKSPRDATPRFRFGIAPYRLRRPPRRLEA